MSQSCAEKKYLEHFRRMTRGERQRDYQFAVQVLALLLRDRTPRLVRRPRLKLSR